MKVSKENCKGCSVFDDATHQDNMIKNNICLKQCAVGCPREEDD